jgi:putative transposase
VEAEGEDRQSTRERRHRLPKEAYQGRVTVMFTLCAEGRKKVFTEPDLVRDLIVLLADAVTKHKCCVPVFTFMPDHLHLLVRGETDQSDTRAAMCSFRRTIGIRFPDIDLQKDFYDHIVKWFEGCENKAWYIANNPVRAGLIREPFQWPFTGSIGCDLRDTFGR